MRTEHLEYLLDLQKTSSLSKTAENYFTSDQVINNAIKALEKEFNVTILNRTHRGIHFTEAGELFCNYAKKIFSTQQDFLEQLHPYANPSVPVLNGELAIYTIPRFSNRFFLDFFDTYCSKHPQMNISLKNLAFDKILKQIEQENNPFIILTAISDLHSQVSDDILQLSSHFLTYDILTTQLLGYCISKNSKYYDMLLDSLMLKNSIDDVKLPIIVHNYSIESIYSSTSVPDSYHLVDNFEVQQRMIKSGNYIGIWTYQEYQQHFSKNSNIQFLPLLDDTPFHYLALYHTDCAEDPAISSFIASLKRLYQ